MQVQQASNSLIIHSDPQPLLRHKHYCPNSQAGLMPRNITRSTQKLATDQRMELNSRGAEQRLQLEALSHSILAVWHAKQGLPRHRAVEISDTARSQSSLWQGQHSKDAQSLLEGGTATQPSNLATTEAPRHLANPSGSTTALNLLNGKVNASHLLATPSVRQSRGVH